MEGPRPADEFGNPWKQRTARFSLLNPFDHTGARAYKHIKFVEPGDDYPAAVAMVMVMAQPEVACLHVRSATAQCFTFEVRPA
jgi:hypothetical protein